MIRCEPPSQKVGLAIARLAIFIDLEKVLLDKFMTRSGS